MIILFNQRIDLVLILAVVLVGVSVLYSLTMLVLSHRTPRQERAARPTPVGVDPARAVSDVVFVIPCLNEERVLRGSLDRLVSLEHPRLHVLVVDDGSDDGTAEIAASYPDARVHLLRRRAPGARQGKGEALNAAIRHIRSGAVARGTVSNDVVVCVVDADGRLEPHVLDEVLPLFADQQLGAVQIGVRINNRDTNLLARMQDVEFVLYTEVFQRGRRHLGSVCLGGNGQFVRLSALYGLGPSPWSRSLSEDLDLGVRLLLDGWSTEFNHRTAVHQQGLVDVGRWIRQRARWFQGHLQSWTLVPWVLRNLAGTRRVDLLYHLTSPFLLLVTSFLSLAFFFWILAVGLDVALDSAVFSPWWLSAYLIAFGPALLFGVVYWRNEREHGQRLWHAVLLMHLYVAYALLWYAAGWRATVRSLTGRTSWAKTDRTADDQVPEAAGTGSGR
ncbi:glycosyltransferase family 2 protein [Kocuria kalidii]|uniref:glycosyltransferase family 2 protein n=1 Tax=Kocuria kalidii TaxID=3376283 RepID=UPI00378FBF06